MNCRKVYEVCEDSASYKGITLDNNFEEYLSTRVKNRFYDIEGTDELTNEFKDIASTGFEESLLVDIFSIDPNIEDWKIGEALAECYLQDYDSVRFYYNYIRDAKNPKANLHGADLVGFIEINGETIFLFGEVKTSGDEASPPQVMSGRSGMIQQLENIKDNPKLRESIIRWLGFKTRNLSEDDPFRKDYKNALTIYLNYDREKIKLIGVLIRDTQPVESDLKSGYERLKNRLYSKMHIELVALYIPIPINEMKNYIS